MVRRAGTTALAIVVGVVVLGVLAFGCVGLLDVVVLL